ncbi:ABC transporter substrate-binding protein [Candidatus Jorgensenbacteria bacterium]|nr:ABC transporter substrate-binding protein [Candidatus Jorgensenbacteria bacterium]
MQQHKKRAASMGDFFGWLVLLGLLTLAVAVYRIAGVDVFIPSSEETSLGFIGDETIMIGVILPFSGEGVVYGETMNRVFEIAASEINDQGGIRGRKLELVIEDGNCSRGGGAAAMERLLTKKNMRIVIGGFCDEESVGALRTTPGHSVTLFSPVSRLANLGSQYYNFARAYPGDSQEGKALAMLTYGDGKFVKAAVLYENTDRSFGIYSAFKKEFERLGGALLERQIDGTTNIDSMLSEIISQKYDTLAILTQTRKITAAVLDELPNFSKKNRFILSDFIVSDDELINKYSTFIEGGLAVEFSDNFDNEKFEHLRDAYRTRYGTTLPYSKFARTVYDSLFIIRDAIIGSGYDEATIAKWLRGLFEWPGASGLVTIDSNGDRISGYVPKILNNGRLVSYKR